MRTLSWNTDQQTVSRAECFNIKFTAGIFHTWSGECIYLQLTIVGGRHGTDALFVKMGKDCDGKCRTFCRVSTGSELIEKDGEWRFAFLRKETTLVICEEKVLNDCSILCSSPISA